VVVCERTNCCDFVFTRRSQSASGVFNVVML